MGTLADFTIKKGNRRPELTVSLLEAAGGAGIVLDPDNDTVTFIMTGVGDSIELGTVVSAPAEIIDGDNGGVKYAWGVNDTANPGTYGAEWLITFQDGRKEVVPAHGYMTITIEDTLY